MGQSAKSKQSSNLDEGQNESFRLRDQDKPFGFRVDREPHPLDPPGNALRKIFGVPIARVPIFIIMSRFKCGPSGKLTDRLWETGCTAPTPCEAAPMDYPEVAVSASDFINGPGIPLSVSDELILIGPKLKSALVDFSEFDCSKILVSREEIMRVNPHRFEMALLDGILFQTEERIVGFKDVSSDEFWVRGHFPGRPLMPGVLMCESAAQLSSYFALTNNMVSSGTVGLGGLENIRFRGPVVPGDKLIIMMKRNRVRHNIIFNAEFQGYIDQNLVVDGIITGVVLK